MYDIFPPRPVLQPALIPLSLLHSERKRTTRRNHGPPRHEQRAVLRPSCSHMYDKPLVFLFNYTATMAS